MDFAHDLQKLNKAQRLAVETIEGPVMVVAGPGTGKTQVLTLRIANIIKKTDTPPESVLALTFTESAAAGMRQRLVEIMGAEGYRVSIKTIHGFCNEVIQNYPEEFRHISGATNITDVDQIRLVRKLLDASGYPLLRSFGDPYRNVRDILSAISDLKREGKSPKAFEQIIKAEKEAFEDIEDLYHEKGAHKGEMKGKYQTQEKQLERLSELVKLYGAYQAALLKEQVYDYDDMIMEVAAALEKNKSLRFSLQEQYLYILVDEHQDTNQSQNKVIELLASFHQSPNLFVVGDEKQAIYRFQGASVENFTYFQKKFQGAKLIPLVENYRSHQLILDAAFDVAKRGALKANVKHPKQKIKLAAFSEPDVENYFIATDIAQRLKAGAKAEEIAVLYRDNKDSAPIARMLEKVGVPFVVASDEDVLEDNDIKKLLLLLAGVRDFGKDYALVPLLYIDFLGIKPIDVILLLDAARAQKNSVFVLVRDKKALERIVPESAAKIFALYENLSLWKAMSKNDSLTTTFEAVTRDSGLLASIVSSSEKMAKVHALFDELKTLIQNHKNATLESFLEHLEIMREHRVRIKAGSTGSPAGGRVNLMTAHKAKGLEFEYVYIVGATHGHWGGRHNRDLIKLPLAVYSSMYDMSYMRKKGKMELEEGDSDERNVFYVALTRAKKEVVITYAQKNSEGKDQLVSEFVSQIRAGLVERVETAKIEKEFSQHRDIEFKPAAKTPDSKERAFLRQRFLERGLTVSGLNNYLECPQKFYLLNLVGIPEAPNKFAQFGNAAHFALKVLTQWVNEGKKMSKAQFLSIFEKALSWEPIGERDYQDMIAKGKKSLGAYFDKYYKSWPKGSKAEYPISGVKVGRIEVRGRLDRVDFLGGMPKHTTAGGEVVVVDYKTGKIKTRNEIAGLTKNTDGNFRRQLAFYMLLVERGTKFKVKSCELDFIEPDQKGRFHREPFIVNDKEVKELEKEIVRVSEEILGGKLGGPALSGAEGCGERECAYCALRP